MDSGDFWAKRKEHPGWNAVRTAAMLATGLDALDAEDEREAVRARRWRHNIQKIMLQTSPAVALIPEEAREVTGWLSEIEAYDKMTLYCLNYSKLDKVLHRVAMLEGSPKVRQDPYDICVRARALSERWQPGSLPRTLHEHRSPRLPPALRALPPTVMALDVQPHANPLDLLAAVSIAERLAARSRRPARRVLVSSSAQTDDAFSDGVNGVRDSRLTIMHDAVANRIIDVIRSRWIALCFSLEVYTQHISPYCRRPTESHYHDYASLRIPLYSLSPRKPPSASFHQNNAPFAPPRFFIIQYMGAFITPRSSLVTKYTNQYTAHRMHMETVSESPSRTCRCLICHSLHLLGGREPGQSPSPAVANSERVARISSEFACSYECRPCSELLVDLAPATYDYLGSRSGSPFVVATSVSRYHVAGDNAWTCMLNGTRADATPVPHATFSHDLNRSIAYNPSREPDTQTRRRDRQVPRQKSKGAWGHHGRHMYLMYHPKYNERRGRGQRVRRG